jgi:type IV secretory pathway VirB10-like protein
MGHNQGPPYDEAEVARLDAEGAKFLDAAATWLENGELQSEDDAQRLNDFIAGLKKRKKAADDARKAAKKPHDDAGKAVQAAYTPILKKMDAAVAKVSPLLSQWLEKKEAERRAEVERQRKEAEFKQQEAERKAAEAAARNDISGEIDAEAAQKEAEAARKEAERAAKARANVASATGGGRTASLRTFIEVEVVNPRVLFMRYAAHPDLLECLRNLAAREARTKDFDAEKDEIPGAKITVTRRAV